jgi:hypothetical protein
MKEIADTIQRIVHFLIAGYILRDKMKVLELFSGTASFSNEAKKRGYETFTVDIDSRFKPDLVKSVLDLLIEDIPFNPDILWVSPPCQCFSVASISTHWGGGYRKYEPITIEAEQSKMMVIKTVGLINRLRPKYFFIENPRGVLRKLGLIPYPLKTCCYCQYGDIRMKPTDIWTNLDTWVPKMCHNGCKDHEEARRGAKTGTQGLKGCIDRSRVPPILCNALLDVIEG